MIKPEFFDTINYSICKAVNERLGEDAKDFFRRVGECHLDEVVARGFFTLDRDERPLDTLIRLAQYLESTGYMDKIVINKLSEKEAIVEMHGVTVTHLPPSYSKKASTLPTL